MAPEATHLKSAANPATLNRGRDHLAKHGPPLDANRNHSTERANADRA